MDYFAFLEQVLPSMQGLLPVFLTGVLDLRCEVGKYDEKGSADRLTLRILIDFHEKSRLLDTALAFASIFEPTVW